MTRVRFRINVRNHLQSSLRYLWDIRFSITGQSLEIEAHVYTSRTSLMYPFAYAMNISFLCLAESWHMYETYIFHNFFATDFLTG